MIPHRPAQPLPDWQPVPQRGRPPVRLVLEIDPTRSHRPTVNHIPAIKLAAHVVAGTHPVDVADAYGITREEVLLACWWEVKRWDGKAPHRNRPRTRAVYDAWLGWAGQATDWFRGDGTGSTLPNPPQVP